MNVGNSSYPNESQKHISLSEYIGHEIKFIIRSGRHFRQSETHFTFPCSWATSEECIDC